MVSSSSSSDSGSTIVEVMLYERVYNAVERSMCPQHFYEFISFHDGLCDFVLLVAGASPVVKDLVYATFPPPHGKVGREKWVNFDTWLMFESGELIRDICTSWCMYGKFTIRTCEHCRDASIYSNLVIVDDEDDSEVEEPYNNEAEDNVAHNENVHGEPDNVEGLEAEEPEIGAAGNVALDEGDDDSPDVNDAQDVIEDSGPKDFESDVEEREAKYSRV
ncbi:hypothetical protein FRX31_028807 [Thalictrum thalictroides]|uniref:Uncharacterized protein n=1 Tax=Thalictrum thalictroides TaxID=46969 RepID=A0A7J6VAA1_THATH|nr:hypothetical protein FRX31_028807 [Thalictrum thalictroides]